VGKSDRKSGRRETRDERTSYRFKNRQTRDGNILKDAFRLNAANEIVVVKKRWNGR
jgi:uncharacterized protein YxjI